MAQKLKVVMAQLNFRVGDIDGNTEIVIENSLKAVSEHSADVIVFPELTLTGSPMEDLLLRPSLQNLDSLFSQISQKNVLVKNRVPQRSRSCYTIQN